VDSGVVERVHRVDRAVRERLVRTDECAVDVGEEQLDLGHFIAR
jgi:hypothetical protein